MKKQGTKAREAQRHAAGLGRGSFGSSKPKAIGPPMVPKVKAYAPFKPLHK